MWGQQSFLQFIHLFKFSFHHTNYTWGKRSRFKTINSNFSDHVERKVPKYENHKIRERKVKTLTRNWRDHRGIDTQKHTETVSRYFDRHGCLHQSEESTCLWTHAKMASLESWWKVPPGGCERDGWRKNFVNRKRVNVCEHTQRWRH